MNIDEELTNKFILYYTISYMWKRLHPGKISELHRLLFPSSKTDNGVRTAYDAILRFDYYPLQKWFPQLEEISGISKDIWSGKKRIKTEIADSLWDEFTEIRTNCTKGSPKYYAIERDIEEKLTLLYSDRSRQDSEMRKLLFFLKYKDKEKDTVLGGRLNEIELFISEIGPHELETVEMIRLLDYQKIIDTHARRIAAVVDLKKWRGEN